MIPKVIHLCWISDDPYPEKIQRCIASWQKYLPDYSISLWNKQRVLSVGGRWCAEAIEARKYAFAADYVRLYALYHYGGVYLDSDVEVLRNIDHLLSLPYFVGFENEDAWIEMAALGAEPQCKWIKRCLDYYRGGRRHFVDPFGHYRIAALPYVVKQQLKHGYALHQVESNTTYGNDAGIVHLQPLGFCVHPDATGAYNIQPHTHFVHHYAGSWCDGRTEVPVHNAMQRLLNIFYPTLRRTKRWLLGKPIVR